MDVSKNRGTPKSSILIGVFHYKPSILGYHIFGKRLNGEWEFDGRGCCKLRVVLWLYLLESVGRCGDRIDVVLAVRPEWGVHTVFSPVPGIMNSSWWMVVMIMMENGLRCSRWLFQVFFIFTPTWGNDPIWPFSYFSMGLKPQTSVNWVHFSC